MKIVMGILCGVVIHASAFQSSKSVVFKERSLLRLFPSDGNEQDNDFKNQQQISKGDALTSIVSKRRGILAPSAVGIATGLCSFVFRGMAASEDVEFAELPPPYVPAIFAVVLLAGVGLLTASLGDVLDEGECLFQNSRFDDMLRVMYLLLWMMSVNLFALIVVPFFENQTEASLGLQSGARAKKEIERSKSSYFKK